MNMRQKILYLTEIEWISTWVNGGTVPLYHVKKYKALERKGTQTTDECLQRELHGAPYEDFNKVIKVKHEKDCSVILGGIGVGNNLWKNINFHQKEIGGIALCLSNNFKPKVAKEFKKKAAIVIPDYFLLKEILDEQIGVKSKAERVKYTTSGNRGHFLKGKDDEWQDEFRLLWELDNTDEVKVKIPKGIAREFWRDDV